VNDPVLKEILTKAINAHQSHSCEELSEMLMIRIANFVAITMAEIL